MPSAPPSPGVQELVARGRVIEAVKLYRQETGAGLAEARSAVDALPRDVAPLVTPEDLPTRDENGRTLAFVAAVLLGLAGLAVTASGLIRTYLSSDWAEDARGDWDREVYRIAGDRPPDDPRNDRRRYADAAALVFARKVATLPGAAMPRGIAIAARAGGMLDGQRAQDLYTALHLSCRYNSSTDTVLALLDARADPTLVSRGGQPPALVAAAGP